jgi:EmrB/QacA subfamily drug resistance transporter
MENRPDNADIAYRGKATLVVMLNSFLIVFHFTVINVAFPQIQTAFGANVETIRWVFNAMLVSSSVILPVAGWLGRAIGLKNMYLLGLSIYVFATLLAGSAWSIDSLIAYQVFQGVGTGILMVVTVALVADVYPMEKRGKGMAYWSIANSLGGAAGPLMGGYLADNFSWRLIFYVNTPLALVSFMVCLLFLRKDEQKFVEKFDYAGFALIGVAVVSLLVALSQGRIEGWDSDYIVSLLIIFVVSFAAWIFTEMKVENPLIDLSLFKDKFFVAGITVTFVIGVSLYGTNFLMPLFMQSVLGYSVLRSAVIIVIGVLVAVFFSRISGPLTDAYSPRVPLLIGIGFWSLFCFIFGGKDTRVAFATLGVIMILRGVGYGLTLPPMMSGSLTTLPPRLITMASGILNLTFTLGGMFGIAILGTLLDKQELTHYANYASGQNPSSPSTVDAVSLLQSFFSGLGHVPAHAKGMALTVLSGVLRREAVVSAFQDGFIFLSAVTLLALLPALVMGRVQRR